jgi:hypothetical protein
MQSLQRKFLRQAAEECKETNYDTMVRPIYTTKSFVLIISPHSFCNLELSCTQEENTDGLNLTAKSFSTNCSISTYSQDESDVGKSLLISTFIGYLDIPHHFSWTFFFAKSIYTIPCLDFDSIFA